MSYIDPTTYRLSDSFLLSDFMGCDSVYRFGYRNRITDSAEDAEKLEHGRFLAETIELLQEDFGPCLVCYGYISPQLSQRIVKYQDPHKPSYHRWEIGAAADLHFPEWTRHHAPIGLACEIDDNYEYSRMITYSESEWVCFATNEHENPSREAFYENRYVSEQKKPLFIRYSSKKDTRNEQKTDALVLKDPWRGQGWPRYHGGGRRQYEHMSISDYSNVGSFLYSRDSVHNGIQNKPIEGFDTRYNVWNIAALNAGYVIDTVIKRVRKHVSVTSAYNATDYKCCWDRFYTLELVPPLGFCLDELAQLILETCDPLKVYITKHKEPRLRVIGRTI